MPDPTPRAGVLKWMPAAPSAAIRPAGEWWRCMDGEGDAVLGVGFYLLVGNKNDEEFILI